MLPLPETAAMGEMLVGTSSREASPSSILAWDEVSAGQGRSSGFHGEHVKITAVVGLCNNVLLLFMLILVLYKCINYD